MLSAPGLRIGTHLSGVLTRILTFKYDKSRLSYLGTLAFLPLACNPIV